jgi:hypothetical protein
MNSENRSNLVSARQLRMLQLNMTVKYQNCPVKDTSESKNLKKSVTVRGRDLLTKSDAMMVVQRRVVRAAAKEQCRLVCPFAQSQAICNRELVVGEKIVVRFIRGAESVSDNLCFHC